MSLFMYFFIECIALISSFLFMYVVSFFPQFVFRFVRHLVMFLFKLVCVLTFIDVGVSCFRY